MGSEMKEKLGLWFTLATSGWLVSILHVPRLPIKCIHFYVVTLGPWAQSHPLFIM